MKKLTPAECYKIINPVKNEHTAFLTLPTIIMASISVLLIVLKLMGLIGGMMIFSFALSTFFAVMEIIFISGTTSGIASKSTTKSLLLRCSPRAKEIVTGAFVYDEIRRVLTYGAAALVIFALALIPEADADFNAGFLPLLLASLCSVSSAYFSVSAFVYLLRRLESSLVITYFIIMLAATIAGITGMSALIPYMLDNSLPVMLAVTPFMLLLAYVTGVLNCKASIKKVLANYYGE